MKEIKLSNSDKVALVDDEDFERVSKYKWKLEEGSKPNNFYVKSWIKGRNISLHKFVLKIGRYTGIIIEHKNGNSLDCQKDNISQGNQSHNRFNARLNSNNATGLAGVSFEKDRNKYRARIAVNDVDINLGRFKSLDLALLARIIGEIRYYGHPLIVFN